MSCACIENETIQSRQTENRTCSEQTPNCGDVATMDLGVEHVLDISSSDHGPLRGGNGIYVVDSIGENFLGLSITDYFYWVQLEIQQASAATTKTRNSVIGLELLLAIPS